MFVTSRGMKLGSPFTVTQICLSGVSFPVHDRLGIAFEYKCLFSQFSGCKVSFLDKDYIYEKKWDKVSSEYWRTIYETAHGWGKIYN